MSRFSASLVGIICCHLVARCDCQALDSKAWSLWARGVTGRSESTSEPPRSLQVFGTETPAPYGPPTYGPVTRTPSQTLGSRADIADAIADAVAGAVAKAMTTRTPSTTLAPPITNPLPATPRQESKSDVPTARERFGGFLFAIPSLIGKILMDPLGSIMEIIVIIVLVWLLVAMWHNPQKILYVITGDPDPHVDRISMRASCVKFLCCCCCCGDGECTRWFTQWGCVNGCFDECFGTKLYQRNLLTAMLQYCGLRSVPVRISSLVIGDLPGNSRADYYVTFASPLFPEMTTSVAEQQLPKVVQFPETLVLRVRDHALEPKIAITVKKFNFSGIGHTEVASCQISAKQFVEWTQLKPGEKPLKRIALHTIEHCEHDKFVTAAWICMKIEDADEEAKIEKNTSIWHSSVLAPADSGIDFDKSGILSNIGVFKKEVPLITSENKSLLRSDVKEEQLLAASKYRAGYLCCKMMCRIIAFAFLFGLMFFHYYFESCRIHFESLTISKNMNQTYPSSDKAKELCMTMLERGANDIEKADCQPSCKRLEGEFKNWPNTIFDKYPTKGQPWSNVTILAFKREVGVEGYGIPCYRPHCWWNRTIDSGIEDCLTPFDGCFWWRMATLQGFFHMMCLNITIILALECLWCKCQGGSRHNISSYNLVSFPMLKHGKLELIGDPEPLDEESSSDPLMGSAA